MNFQKFTQKSVEAINEAQSIAREYGNQELREEHVLSALVDSKDGLIGGLISKITNNKFIKQGETNNNILIRAK